MKMLGEISMDVKQYDKISNITVQKQDEIFSKANVVGLGVGHKIKGEVETDEPCLTVFVSQKVDKELLTKTDLVPKTIQDIQTDVINAGTIFAGPAMTKELLTTEEVEIEVLRQRLRPAMGGFSVGHYRITAGTIATCVYDLSPFPGIPKRYFILSNNHVLANSNNARIGDPILQPGPYDGGTIPRDIIARLTRFVPILFHTATRIPHNYVDAAIAEGAFHDLNREIYWIGYVKQVNSRPQIGDIVEKTGRTTNFTTGKILALNATVDVNYGSGRVARFVNQIVTSNMSAGGDSGSLVCDLKEGAVGLLFAGSHTITIVNNILYVQKLLGIRLHP
jgi:hypothetical protein